MISRALHRCALLVALATFILLIAGGLVTSHGVGMAVPDWPNSYGYNMFFFPVSNWVGGIFYEHTHRLIASAVGMLTGILTLWLYGRKSRPVSRWTGAFLLAGGGLIMVASSTRMQDGIVLSVLGLPLLLMSFIWPRSEPAPRWLRRLGLAAFVAVILQGILGGLRVVLLKDGLGIFHAVLAQLFFVLVSLLALFTSPWWWKVISQHEGAATLGAGPLVRFWFFAGTSLIFAQLILGATMRHQHAGLAVPDFPLAYGKLWPAMDPKSVGSYNCQRIEVTTANPITAFQIGLHMAHRCLGFAIFACVSAAALVVRRRLGSQNVLSKLALFWNGLIALQIGLGAATIWSNKAADVATAHVMVGALSLTVGAIACVLSARAPLFARSVTSSPRFAGRKVLVFLCDP
jgi:cytochrome c oxidase assembly protein subunit 15